MSNSNFHFDPNPAKHNSLLQLGYLTNSHQPKPFVLGLEDLSNLFVVGSRALDIYYKMFIQLCDEQKIPILVFMGVEATGDEDEICESPIWNLNLLTEIISFNLLDFTEGHYLFQYISILISLLEDFAPLSSTARNLLHIIFWKALFNVYKPTFQYFQSILYTYRHYGAVYNELCRLLVAIPQEFFMLNYDTLSLNRIQHLPTIISGFDSPKT
ncbi:MAG: hypothetical protein ACFFD8_03865, partial [Candidatus Thorarchaeota archaeon]